MKIIILMCMLILLVGCNSNIKELEELVKYDLERSITRADRIQEKWDLWDRTDLDCVFDNCKKKCDFDFTINMMDYDYNEDGEIDDFEYEVMNSAGDRKSRCFNDCIDNDWEYMDDCRNTTGVKNYTSSSR